MSRESSSRLRTHRPIRLPLALAAILAVVVLVALRSIAPWYGRPVASVLVTPDGVVSGVGLPGWDAYRQGLRFPDRFVEIDGLPLAPRPGGPSVGDAWNAAVASAARAGHAEVVATVASERGLREVRLPILPFDALAWWLYGGALVFTGALFGGAAALALWLGRGAALPSAFAKAAFAASLFLITLLDFHTQRSLVPVFEAAFALAPIAVAILSLRLPDDVRGLAARRWVFRALEGLAVLLAASTVAERLLTGQTLVTARVCSVGMAASATTVAVVTAIRYARSAGTRRAIMRALLWATAPVMGAMSLASVFAWRSSATSAAFYTALPALAFIPFTVMRALVRHDLWGTRALLSRIATRGAIGFTAGLLAVATTTAVGASLGIGVADAALVALVAAASTTFVVGVTLHLADRALFRARAEYRPTVFQLSSALRDIDTPDGVAEAIVSTVQSFLPCERVWVEPAPDGDAGPRPEDAPSGTRRIQEIDVERDEEGNLVLELRVQQRTMGTLRVGPKSGGALFTSEDVELLRTIANQAALALAYAHAYAALEEQRKTQVAAWKGERAVLVETLAAEVAHEVRYPINFFRSVFGRKGARELDDEEVEIGREEVDRLERLVSGLRRATLPPPTLVDLPLPDLVRRAELVLRDRLTDDALLVDVPADVAIRCSADQTTQILVNLLANALDAADGGRVGVSFVETDAGADLVVWDEGKGFELEPSRLFAPWVTTKPRGTGLGLAITHRLVRAHGWTIDARRGAKRTEFVVRVPRGALIAVTVRRSVA